MLILGYKNWLLDLDVLWGRSKGQKNPKQTMFYSKLHSIESHQPAGHP